MFEDLACRKERKILFTHPFQLIGLVHSQVTGELGHLSMDSFVLSNSVVVFHVEELHMEAQQLLGTLVPLPQKIPVVWLSHRAGP